MDETESGLRYLIDAERGSFTVQAFAEGMLSFMGHNPTFAVGKYGGEIQLAGDNAAVDSMLLIVQANSLSLLDKLSEKDRAEIERAMKEDVLEITRFPEIVFASRDVSIKEKSGGKFAVTASGVISLHGEKKQKTIEAEAEISGRNIRAGGEFALNQRDFNIEKVKALGGTLKVKDEVKISFDITAFI